MKHYTIGLFGNLGDGKTLGMSVLGHYGYIGGCYVSANYKITGYPNTLLTSGMQLKNVSTDNNLYLMDELWVEMDSRLSGVNVEMSRRILQMRKKDISLIYTAQDIDQLDKRPRRITNIFLFPQVIFNDDDYPIYVKYHYTRKAVSIENMKEYINYLPFFILPVQVNGFDVADNYDTSEIVEGMESEQTVKAKELICKYVNFEGTKTELESILVLDENITKTKAGVIASYIKSKGGIKK